MSAVGFIAFGYLSGSILYVRVFAKLFGKEGLIEKSRDRNPGATNAFQFGGFWCGALTLLFDLLKGLLPISLYTGYCQNVPQPPLALSFVLAAPVVGHIFPIFYKFKGGKGITTTFGCLLGLFPFWQPAVLLAVFFIFFSVILRITPHFHRTLAAYFFSLPCMAWVPNGTAAFCGFLLITFAVAVRMFTSHEEKERMRVRLLWMH